MPHQDKVPPDTEIPGAVLVEPEKRVGGLDQLDCPSDVRQQLEELAAWRTRGDDLASWGGGIAHGPVVLFTGASGTGKTMAAQALAANGGLSLYRVDMGMLVSKYVGNTPKNINQLFRHARRTEAVLLFDEAEGLFGKRSVAKETRDRHTNMGVGHLLSRMEEYPGICLLTANTAEQIDPGVLRRINLTIDFPPTR